jgi:hypothetical protein
MICASLASECCLEVEVGEVYSIFMTSSKNAECSGEVWGFSAGGAELRQEIRDETHSRVVV